MQTKPDTEVGAITGAVQVPLLRREQVVPGVIFTGIAADHVHEVIELAGDDVWVQRLPREPQAVGHGHAYNQYTNTTCVCGLGRRPLTALLSEDGTTPRVHILVPTGPLVTPDAYSVYLYAGLRTLTIDAGRATRTADANDEVPIMLKAWKIWGLPEAARRLMQDNEISETTEGSAD